ncbi:MAG: hypothetical protein WCG45_04165 [bacterium]
MKKKSKKTEENELSLEAISQYKMDDLESKAYKIAIKWVQISKKIFPNYNHTGIKKGDPRKSLIFKFCYKLARETAGLIPEDEYELYIRSQLDVIKHMSNGSPVLVTPACLVGDKAWSRWKLWKRKYDKIVTKPTSKVEVPQSINKTGFYKAFAGLDQTKEFFNKNSLVFNLATFQEKKSDIIRWTNLNKISPYYICISPLAKNILQKEDYARMNFDMSVYSSCINEEVLNKFKELFPEEFK